jgi:hypothetical protein
MSQLPLPIDWDGGRQADRLLVTDANRAALALLRDWRRWPGPASLLVGEARSGRSLAGRLFAAESGGALIDDADQADEAQLFHAWNIARESGRPLLLVARTAPPAWVIALPDLRTRLATAAVARIGPPDEAIAAALVVRGLEAAGSAYASDLPEFVARRVTRCYESIDRLIALLNAESLTSARKLTLASARGALEALASQGLAAGQKDEGTGTGG